MRLANCILYIYFKFYFYLFIYFYYIFSSITFPHCCSSLKEVRTGTQADQEAGADAEAIEGCSLLACFPWLAQPRNGNKTPMEGVTETKFGAVTKGWTI